MSLPTSVRIAGEYYAPVVLRIEDFREHDMKPDNLTYIDDDDVAELSENPDKNRFVVVYAKKGSFGPKGENVK